MSAVERLAILVTADGNGAIREFTKVGQAAERELGGAENRADRLGSRMTTAGAVMMSASAVMAAGMWNVGKSAAALEQAVGGSEAVFKDSAGVLKAWAKGADQAAGLSEEAALRLTTRLGGALKGLGYDQQAAADQSMELAQIAADLAATYGGTTADAVQALGAAYRGEFDPAEQFNLFLKQSTVDAKAVEMGLAKSTTQVDAYARAQATTALILEQSQDAQGQFARELDTTSGQLAVATAEFENAKAQIGAGFLPVMAKAGEVAGTAASGIASADEASGGLLSTALGIGTVVLGAAGAISFIGGQAVKARDQFKSAHEAIQNFSASHSNLVNGLAAGAIAIGGAVAAWQLWEQAIHDTDDMIKDINERQIEFADTASLDQLKGRIHAIDIEVGSLNTQIESLWSPLDVDNAFQLDEMKDKLQQTREELSKFASTAEGLAVLTGASADQTLAWLQAQKAAGITYDDLSVAAAAYTGQIDTNTLSTEQAVAATVGYAQSLRDVASAAKAATDPFFATLDATQQLDKAQQEAFLTSLSYAEGTPEMVAANEAVARAAANVEGSYLALAAQMSENGATSDEMKAAFQRWVDQGWITQAQADQMITKFGDLGAKADEVGGKSIDVPVSAPNVDHVIGRLDALKGRVFEINTAGGIRLGATLGGGFSQIPGSAGGGGLHEGWNVVGEAGPEAIWKQGGTVDVYPNTKPVSGRAPAGGAQIVFNVAVSGGGSDGGGSALLDFLRRNQGEVQRALGLN